jgi:hypothetical protein
MEDPSFLGYVIILNNILLEWHLPGDIDDESGQT